MSPIILDWSCTTPSMKAGRSLDDGKAAPIVGVVTVLISLVADAWCATGTGAPKLRNALVGVRTTTDTPGRDPGKGVKMCDIEDEMRERQQGLGQDWRAWQAKHGAKAAQPKPLIETRRGNDGVVREYCTTCGWGWKVGTKPDRQVHQNGCINVPTSQLGRPRR